MLLIMIKYKAVEAVWKEIRSVACEGPATTVLCRKCHTSICSVIISIFIGYVKKENLYQLRYKEILFAEKHMHW